MALTNCKECDKEVSTEAKACPHCGAKVPHTKWWLWIPVSLVAIFLLFAFTKKNSPAEDARWNDRQAISMCWENQKQKSLDPGTQQFIASTCEAMEQKFKTAYGINP